MNSISTYPKPKRFICSVFLCMTLFIASSCVDKSYNWDDMDTTGVFNIPPIMLGNIDPIYLNGLPAGIFPEGVPITGFERVLSDTITGIFEGDAIQDFFFDGADAVKIEAKADVVVKKVPADSRILLYFNVIDYEEKRIQEVVIPQQELHKGADQALTIEIASKYMKYMERARSLEITIVIMVTDGTVWISEDDYILLKSVIVKTGGYHFDL